MSILRRISIVAVGLFALATAPLATAAEDGTQFKDWMVRCPEPPEGQDIEGPACFIFQNLAIRENNQPVLSVRVGYAGGGDQPAAVLTTPLGVFLPAGIEVAVDDSEPTRVAFQVCNQGGCIAALPLADGRLEAFKAGKQARVSFQDGRRQPVAVPVSLSGFTAGFESLR